MTGGSDRRWGCLAGVAIALGTLWTLLVVGSTWFLGARESPTYRCLVDRPGPDLAAFQAAGTIPEAVMPGGTFGWLPLGWTCRWDLGSAVYEYTPGWGATAFALPGVMLAVSALVIIAAGAARRRAAS